MKIVSTVHFRSNVRSRLVIEGRPHLSKSVPLTADLDGHKNAMSCASVAAKKPFDVVGSNVIT